MKKLIYRVSFLLIIVLLGLTISCKKEDYNFDYGSLSDIEGNTYKTIKIGEQTWMAENLRVTKYNDGQVISMIVNDSIWSITNKPGFSWHNNDSIYKSYGAVYNWYASNRNICPTGWHVSTDEDWKELEKYIGISEEDIDKFGNRGSNQGSLLKSRSGWNAEEDGYPENGTNVFGLNISPMSGRSANGGFFFGFSANYNVWTPAENDTSAYFLRFFSAYISQIGRYDNRSRLTIGKKSNYGFCIRCIKDK